MNMKKKDPWDLGCHKLRKGGKILERDQNDLVKPGNEQCRVGSKILR